LFSNREGIVRKKLLLRIACRNLKKSMAMRM
jgi:hypothetical protein